LEDHNERLHNSARILGFEVPASMDDLAKATTELISANRIADGYVRPIGRVIHEKQTDFHGSVSGRVGCGAGGIWSAPVSPGQTYLWNPATDHRLLS
jgi:hypothetical protein